MAALKLLELLREKGAQTRADYSGGDPLCNTWGKPLADLQPVR
jgi:hypothetical protein